MISSGRYNCARNKFLRRYKSQKNFKGFICHYCGLSLKINSFNDGHQYKNTLTIDHLHPKGIGGSKYYINNFRLSCTGCNQTRDRICNEVTEQDKYMVLNKYYASRNESIELHEEFFKFIFTIRTNFIAYG